MKYELASIACFLIVLILMFQGHDARDHGYLRISGDFVRSFLGILAFGGGVALLAAGLLIS